MNITMSEIYEYSKIELHLFAFELNEFEIIDISYKTHPKLRLLTALQMTCSVPVLFTPVFIEDKFSNPKSKPMKSLVEVNSRMVKLADGEDNFTKRQNDLLIDFEKYKKEV